MKTLLKTIGLAITSILCLSACTFAGDSSTLTAGTPGFLMGLWHGLVAPLSLIARFFLDIEMYALPNSGVTYDLGFLIGIVGAIPVGWLATLISVGFYFFA